MKLTYLQQFVFMLCWLRIWNKYASNISNLVKHFKLQSWDFLKCTCWTYITFNLTCISIIQYFHNGNIDLNPFHATGLFLYPLKISENLWLSGGIKRDQWHEMSSWVNHSLFQIQHKVQHKHWNEPFFQNSNELIVMAEFETRTPTLFPNCTFKNTKADQFDKRIQNPVNYLGWSFLLK